MGSWKGPEFSFKLSWVTKKKQIEFKEYLFDSCEFPQSIIALQQILLESAA